MFVVFRHGPGIPREQWAPHMEGKWIEHDPLHITRPSKDWNHLQVTAVAEPVTPRRYEYRDDGERAMVWEIRLVDPPEQESEPPRAPWSAELRSVHPGVDLDCTCPAWDCRVHGDPGMG